MLSTIIVPLDGSALSERVLPYASALARASRARLVLFRALPLVPTDTPWEDARQARGSLETVAERVRSAGLEVTTIVHELSDSDVAGAIVRIAAEERADLIAMSTHGRGGLGRWLYGSVADAVLRRSEVPVLLVSAAATHVWPADRALRILVPLDGSPLAEAALGPAVDLARSLRAELHLLQVVQPPSYVYPESTAYLLYDPERDLAEARQYLDGVATRLRPEGVTVETQSTLGFPTTTIAEVAREQGMDLIVMATHGRTGLARLVLGSVATATLQQASVPVVFVRPAALARAAGEREAAAEPEAVGTGIRVTLTPSDLALIERGLGELIYTPGRDRRLAKPARELLARLKQAEAASLAASGRAPRESEAQPAGQG